ncbi:hypothetical protein DVH24_014442 [Malus domestica]|uniref:Uncharacterized protein n=1 Tax=Malus domestica TaxID=3750 RepID=A0A498KK91_MALDO|nr:hypothetical protein DVH24_014442 [Malus domestica]
MVNLNQNQVTNKQRSLKESDVDSFVDDVLVNHKPWASGVQEPLIGPYVFICAHMSQNEWDRYRARVLIDKFKHEAELRGLTDQVFVTACFHIGGHRYAGNLVIYSPGSDGSITDHWGQIGASSDEAEEINDRELPNGEENMKIEDMPQENSNQIHQEKGNQIENSENGESEEKQLKETRESKSSFVYEPTDMRGSASWTLDDALGELSRRIQNWL